MPWRSPRPVADDRHAHAHAALGLRTRRTRSSSAVQLQRTVDFLGHRVPDLAAALTAPAHVLTVDARDSRTGALTSLPPRGPQCPGRARGCDRPLADCRVLGRAGGRGHRRSVALRPCRRPRRPQAPRWLRSSPPKPRYEALGLPWTLRLVLLQLRPRGRPARLRAPRVPLPPGTRAAAPRAFRNRTRVRRHPT